MDKTLPEPPMNHSLSERRVMALPHQKGSTDGENFMEFNELPVSGHVLGKDDPANPQNLPVLTKIYVSIAAFALAFVVAFGATSYTAGLKGVIERFDVSMQHSILGMSIYFWGIFFAPIYTPHISERFGRRPVYLFCTPFFALFILGASFSQSFGALLVCRFIAGLLGGPMLVLIEGTFADVWSADVTVSYYAVLTLSPFVGTACGPLIGGFLATLESGWRWTQWMTLILTLGAYLFAIGMPETYPREIQRIRAKKTGKQLDLAPAQSGVTLRDMAFVTIVQPLMMMVTDPIVLMLSLYTGFIFATIFQFFVAVPVVLNLTYNFSVADAGVAFTAAIAGVVIATFTSGLCDRLTRPHVSARTHDGKVPEEYRMLPGMIGGIGMTTSFFWIAWTATPKTSYLSPICGTGLFIWGAASVITASISYLFDAYPPRGTLSALTAAACFRIFLAGLIPLFIIPMIMGLTGAWAYSTFGFIAAVLMFIPWIIFFFGDKLREISHYNPGYIPPRKMAAMAQDHEMVGSNMR